MNEKTHNFHSTVGQNLNFFGVKLKLKKKRTETLMKFKFEHQNLKKKREFIDCGLIVCARLAARSKIYWHFHSENVSQTYCSFFIF